MRGAQVSTVSLLQIAEIIGIGDVATRCRDDEIGVAGEPGHPILELLDFTHSRKHVEQTGEDVH